MALTLTDEEIDALASRLQVGPDRRIQCELEIDRLTGFAHTGSPILASNSSTSYPAMPSSYTLPAVNPAGDDVVLYAKIDVDSASLVTVTPDAPGWVLKETNYADGTTIAIFRKEIPSADGPYADSFHTAIGHAWSAIQIAFRSAGGADPGNSNQDVDLFACVANPHSGVVLPSAPTAGRLILGFVSIGGCGPPYTGSMNWTYDAGWTGILDEEVLGSGVAYRVADGTPGEDTFGATRSQNKISSQVTFVIEDSLEAEPELSTATRRFQVSGLDLDRSRKMAAAQLDAVLANEDGEKGYYTQTADFFRPGNPVRAYAWHGPRANRVQRYAGLIDRDVDDRDPKRVSIKARSRMKILLEPHRFVAIASQTAGETGAIRTEENGVYQGKSPEYIANDILDRAGWPSAARNIAVSGITIPEYDLSDMGAWADQISGSDRLTTIAGWDMVEDELGVLNLVPSPLVAALEPDPDWEFAPGLNVIALHHEADDEERVTRVQVSGPMTSDVPIWKEEWATTVIRDPVGLAFVPSAPGYLNAIDWKTQYLSQIRLSDRKVVHRWYLGGTITYFPGGLCFDTVTGDFFVLDTDWVHGGTNHAKIQRYDGVTKAHVATYALPDGEWSAIKTDGSNLWLTNYGDDKLYKRSMTGVAVSSGTITYLGDLQHNPTGLWIDGTTIGVFFAGIERFLLVDSAAPGAVTGVQSTKGTQITGGEKDTVAGDILYADAYDASSGHIWAFDLLDQVTTDVVKWAYDQDLEDQLGVQAGIADRVHDLHPGDDPHPFDIRIATVQLKTVNSPDQAQAVADAELFVRRRVRRTLDLATIGHPGIQINDVVGYEDAIAGIDGPWILDSYKERLGDGKYTTSMSVLPWEPPA